MLAMGSAGAHLGRIEDGRGERGRRWSGAALLRTVFIGLWQAQLQGN